MHPTDLTLQVAISACYGSEYNDLIQGLTLPLSSVICLPCCSTLRHSVYLTLVWSRNTALQQLPLPCM